MNVRGILSSSALLVAVAFVSPAHADAVSVSKKVQKKFKGKLFLTSDPVITTPDDDGATIRAFNKAKKVAFNHIMSDGVPAWTFHYTAFLRKPFFNDTATTEIYTADKDSSSTPQTKRSSSLPTNAWWASTPRAPSSKAI
jgi:hypothetical protein